MVFALLPFCPFALMPFLPVALAPPLLSSSAKFGSFLFLFSYFSSWADIVDSPDVTLAGTDDNYDLLLSETIYVYALFGCGR